MKFLAFLLALAISGIAFAEEPEPVKVYCFSADLEAGFKDGDALFYCKQLSKRGEKKNSLIIVDKRSGAQAIIEYMGVEQLTKRGEATYVNYGIAWTPNQDETREAAIVKIGEFAKAFSGSGINAQAAMELVRKTEKWIRENREVILQKAREK
ncbi:MAG: hypothetical protein ACYTBX_20765 [Planctomycetota bacterium]|jgi:hypothetical protein